MIKDTDQQCWSKSSMIAKVVKYIGNEKRVNFEEIDP